MQAIDLWALTPESVGYFGHEHGHNVWMKYV